MRTGNVGAFKLTTVASAYYKGDEKEPPQLQRIYGTAFKNKTELEAYFNMIEEAKKRDHRKIGTEMGLFAIDTEFVGPGLPLWLPKGTAIVEELEKLAKETEFAAGYVRVKTPHIAREKMYTTSGHLPYYAESMFPPIEFRESKLPAEIREAEKILHEAAEEKKDIEIDKEEAWILEHYEKLKPTLPKGIRLNEKIVQFMKSLPAEKQNEAVLMGMERLYVQLGQLSLKDKLTAQLPPLERYYLKAMNCPHHHRIFAAEPRSYRDLPLRLAEYGTCYRYEQSGELFGLMRVRSLNMNDAHIYCTPEQFAQEFNAVNDMYLKYFRIFGIEKYQDAIQHLVTGGSRQEICR